MSHVTHINESWHTEVLKQEMLNFRKLDLFDYNYPLHAAVYAGHTDIVNNFLLHGADKESKKFLTRIIHVHTSVFSFHQTRS